MRVILALFLGANAGHAAVAAAPPLARSIIPGVVIHETAVSMGRVALPRIRPLLLGLERSSISLQNAQFKESPVQEARILDSVFGDGGRTSARSGLPEILKPSAIRGGSGAGGADIPPPPEAKGRPDNGGEEERYFREMRKASLEGVEAYQQMISYPIANGDLPPDSPVPEFHEQVMELYGMSVDSLRSEVKLLPAGPEKDMALLVLRYFMPALKQGLDPGREIIGGPFGAYVQAVAARLARVHRAVEASASPKEYKERLKALSAFERLREDSLEAVENLRMEALIKAKNLGSARDVYRRALALLRRSAPPRGSAPLAALYSVLRRALNPGQDVILKGFGAYYAAVYSRLDHIQGIIESSDSLEDYRSRLEGAFPTPLVPVPAEGSALERSLEIIQGFQKIINAAMDRDGFIPSDSARELHAQVQEVYAALEKGLEGDLRRDLLPVLRKALRPGRETVNGPVLGYVDAVSYGLRQAKNFTEGGGAPPKGLDLERAMKAHPALARILETPRRLIVTSYAAYDGLQAGAVSGFKDKNFISLKLWVLRGIFIFLNPDGSYLKGELNLGALRLVEASQATYRFEAESRAGGRKGVMVISVIDEKEGKIRLRFEKHEGKVMRFFEAEG